MAAERPEGSDRKIHEAVFPVCRIESTSQRCEMIVLVQYLAESLGTDHIFTRSFTCESWAVFLLRIVTRSFGVAFFVTVVPDVLSKPVFTKSFIAERVEARRKSEIPSARECWAAE